MKSGSRIIFWLLWCIVLCIWIQCVPEQEKFTHDQETSLRFSQDSVKFDTVFTSIGSVTRRFKVYNDAKNAVNIEHIALKDQNSAYSIWVNGQAADNFSDITLLGNDSLLVLVEVFIDPEDQDLPYLVTDEVTFLTNNNDQNVKLIAYGQDAVFLDGNILDCSTVWTADRPYVIYNSVLVDTLCTLHMEPGTRIYSHVNSYIYIKGTLLAEGSVENPILMQNDRFEERYINAPGQWGGIIFLEGSKGNVIDHARIKNAENGIYLGTPDDDAIPDLILSHSIIENIGGAEGVPFGEIEIQPGFGILSFNADLYAYNTLIDNCEVNTIGNYAGGNYRYEHCTFANYSFDFFRQNPSVVITDNATFQDGTSLHAPISISLRNSIIWGSIPDEILLRIDDNEEANIDIRDNIIRSQTYRQTLEETNQLINMDPNFIDPEFYDYRLDTLSPAKDAAPFISISDDLEGNPRDVLPDIGAYERIE